jgi:hypothetical protein
MDATRAEASTRALFGESELAVAWLAENDILPVKNRWGRYTLREPPGQSRLTRGEKLLILDSVGAVSGDDVEDLQRQVRDHPRWNETE